MTAKRIQTTKLLAFNLEMEAVQELQKLATAHGFKSPALYCRAVVREHLKHPVDHQTFDRIREMRQAVTERIEGDVLALLHSYTADDFRMK
jgi:hypothetical protein